MIAPPSLPGFLFASHPRPAPAPCLYLLGSRQIPAPIIWRARAPALGRLYLLPS